MKEVLVPYDLQFPLAGLDLTTGYSRQLPRQVIEGLYSRTTPVGTNVIGFEPSTDRARGGSRPGTSRYINAIPSGTAGLIQELAVIVSTGITSPGGNAQSSQSGRIVTLLAIIGGYVYVSDAGGTSWTAATNDTGYTQYLNATGVIRSAVLNQKLYFFDGSHKCYYDPSDNKVKTWGASAGTFPSNTAGTAFPRLGATWNGRLVMAGLSSDPQALFMTAMGDATDFNYLPSSGITQTQAVAGTVSTFGLVGDSIMAVVPFSDDILVVGGDSSVWQLKGDPMSGGRLQRFSDAVGFAFGNAWAKDPYGTLYFMSNRCGIYRMRPNEQPIRISQSIDSLLSDINTGTHIVRMVWNDRLQGLQVFVTSASAAAAATHFFWEARTNAWWKWVFANKNHNPLTVATCDGNLPSDRVNLIGSWDGYVRSLDPDAETDDTVAIASEVYCGPITSDTMDDMMIHTLQGDMGEASENVTFSVLVGRTAENALSSSATASGTLTAGRNTTHPVRRAGHALYVKLSSTKRWAMERIRVEIEGLRGRRRAKY